MEGRELSDKIATVALYVAIGALLLGGCGRATLSADGSAPRPDVEPQQASQHAAEPSLAARAGTMALRSAERAGKLGLPRHAKPRFTTVASPTPIRRLARLAGAYITSAPGGAELLPLNVRTLGRDPSRRAADLAPSSVRGTAEFLESADGSTLVEALQSDSGRVTLRVLDTRTTSELARFPSPGYPAALSADGRYVVVSVGRTTCGPSGCGAPVWDILSTTSGRLVGRIRGPGPNLRWWKLLASPRGHTLYLLTSTGSSDPTERPRTPVLTAYDLATGRRLGSLRLEGLLAGSWQVSEGANGSDFVIVSYDPGVAVSPDGRIIAVVHPGLGALTLVDARRIRTVRTEPIGRSRSLLEILGLAPGAAHAKAFEGTSLEAAFSTDGRTLYVGGTRSWLDARGRQHERGLGVRAVDVRTGRIVVQALKGRQITWLESSPSGDSLLVLASRYTNSTGCDCRLYRLDARSLSVEATRRLDSYRKVYFFGRR